MDKRELCLLNELITNLETNIRNLEGDINIQEDGASSLQYVIDHLENKRALNDSLAHHFQKGQFAPYVILTSSAFETFKSSGLQLVKSNLARREVVNLFEATYPYLMQETKRLEDQLWPAVVLPIVQKHVKLSADGSYQATGYQALLADQEMINILSFRLSLRKASTNRKRTVIDKTVKTNQIIQQELVKRGAIHN